MRGVCPTCNGVGGCADWCGDEAHNGLRLPVDLRDSRARALSFLAIREGWSIFRGKDRKYGLAIDLSGRGQTPHSVLLLAPFDVYERSLTGYKKARMHQLF